MGLDGPDEVPDPVAPGLVDVLIACAGEAKLASLLSLLCRRKPACESGSLKSSDFLRGFSGFSGFSGLSKSCAGLA